MKLLVSIVLAFLFIGCSDNVKEEVQKVETTQVEKDVVQDTKEAIEELKAAAKIKAETVVEPKAVETHDKIIEVTEKAVEILKVEAAEDAAVVEKKVVDAKAEVEKVADAAVSSLDSGKAIFTTCAACHGANAEKVALGKAQIIKGWSATRIIEALQGYKTGTYGGAMKGVMKGQASKLSDDDIKAVAGYISSL